MRLCRHSMTGTAHRSRNLYIFAYDFNGTVLSLPYQPELSRIRPLGCKRRKWRAIRNKIALIRQKRGERLSVLPLCQSSKNMEENSSWAMSGALTITGGLGQESTHRNQMPQMPQAKHIWVRSAAIRSMNQQENSVLPPFWHNWGRTLHKLL